jgi:hypothetical protein
MGSATLCFSGRTRRRGGQLYRFQNRREHRARLLTEKALRRRRPVRPGEEKIGIGRSLTAPPSHTTWHTGPYQGGAVRVHVVVSTSSAPPHLINEVIVERQAYARCMTALPWPFRTPGRRVRQRLGHPTLAQLCLASAVHLPVFPLEAPQTVTNPAGQVA